MEISDEAVLVDCSRLKSVVWKDFDRVRKGDTCVAVCKHCQKKLSGSSTSGTSHLRNHLIRCRRRSNHDIAHLLVSKGKKKVGNLAHTNFSFDQEQRKGDIPNLLMTKYEPVALNNGTISVGLGSFDNMRSRFDLARMIILHGYPLTMVEHVGFKIFIRNLQPLFELVTFDGVEADCKEIYRKEKQKVCEVFDKLPGKISLTADMLTGKGDAKYLCLTAHSIDDTWVLKKMILNFIMVDPSQTEDMLSEVIMTSLMEWDIDRKLFSMTFNCCPTFDNIICKIRDRLIQNRFLLCTGQFFEVRCAANLIKVIVQDCLEALSEIICMIRESIRYTQSSQATQEKFGEMVQLVGVDSRKCLCLDNPFRWNSTYIMLDTASEYKEAFSLLQEQDSAYSLCPSDIDWDRVSTITSFLKMLVEICTLFTRSKHPTANIYFQDICDIHLQLIDWCQSPDEFIRSLALKIKSKFDEYWKKCSMALAIAAILDPQYKMKLVDYYYPHIYGSDSSLDCVDIVSNCMRALYNGHDVYSPLASNGQMGVSSNDKTDRLTGFDRFLQETSQSQNVKSELDKYLEEPVFPQNVDFSILNWWKVHTPRYPVLSMMARNILAIPMSKVVELESMYNTGDRVIDHYQSSLSSETVQALICAQDWMLNGLDGSKSCMSPSTLAICYDVN